MTTTQAQGQFHHLETKQDTDEGSICWEVWSLLRVSLFVRGDASFWPSVRSGMGEGEEENGERD